MSLPNPDLRLLELHAAGREGRLEPLRGHNEGGNKGGAGAGEVAALYALQEAGLKVAPLRIVPAAAEESFYRLNNLPARLNALFAGVDPGDPDEDDIEELAPEAQGLLMTHYLLDEFVDLFYEGLAGLPGRVRLRRPQKGGQARLPGHKASRGRPALLALKALWADDWSFDTLMARLEGDGVALAARPVLVQSAEEARDERSSRAASDILGRDVSVWSGTGGISRVVLD